MRDSHVLRRAVATAMVGSLFVSGAATLAAGAPAGPARPQSAADALGPLLWLEEELAANGGTMPSPFGGTDWGLTLDTVLALNEGARGGSAQATATTAMVADHVNSYITGNDFGDPGVYAGPVGKALVAATRQGADIHAFGGVNLEALSRAAVQTAGVHLGRFSDQGSAFGDFSNGFGQALNIIGLSFTPAGVPADAIDFLLAQQCPAGGFRLNYDRMPVTRGCADDAQADTDATALGLQALTALESTSAVHTAHHHAIDWLLAHQDPVTGGFGGTGPTAAVNSNTTGLVAQALLAVGATEAAGRAEAYVRRLELTSARTAGTPAAGEEGAIAPNQGEYDTARTVGVGPAARDPWRRSTAQAVLAYGLPAFGPPPTLVVLTGARLLDTRAGTATVDGLQVGAGRVGAGQTLVLPVAGRGGVPADAVAVVLNVTATDGGGVGFVTVYPCDASRPNTSSVNFGLGATAANAVVTKLAGDGSVCVFVEGADTQLVADVTGAFM